MTTSEALVQAPTVKMSSEESVHTLPDGLELYAKTWKVCLNLQHGFDPSLDELRWTPTPRY